MPPESAMCRGAREANEESDRLRQARAIGEAIGGLAAFAVALNRINDRLDALELRLREIEGRPS